MLETFIGVALALGLRDLIQEVANRIHMRRHRRNIEMLLDLDEDFRADDD